MIALQALFSLFALAVLVLYLYNGYRVDVLRQELFEIRDSLFDEAAAGRIDFESHAYRATRLVLNGLLRFAHQLSLARFIVALSIVKRQDFAQAGAELDAAISGSSAADREVCKLYIARANAAVAKHLIRSPFSVPLLLWLSSFKLAKSGVGLTTHLLRQMANRFIVLDRVAYVEGLR